MYKQTRALKTPPEVKGVIKGEKEINDLQVYLAYTTLSSYDVHIEMHLALAGLSEVAFS